MILLYTGNGKGKTTAAIGTALRALANNKKVTLVQFLKPGNSSEIKFLKKIPNLTLKSFGKKSLTDPRKLTQKDFILIKKKSILFTCGTN